MKSLGHLVMLLHEDTSNPLLCCWEERRGPSLQHKGEIPILKILNNWIKNHANILIKSKKDGTLPQKKNEIRERKHYIKSYIE